MFMAREHETFAVVLVNWTSFIFYESKRGMHDDSFGPLIGTKYATKLKVGTGKSLCGGSSLHLLFACRAKKAM